QHIRQAYRRALDGEVVSRSEDRLLDAAGRRHWIRWEVRPWRDASGAIAGVLAYIDDISAMARARQDARAYARRLKVALGAADA
ncbi:PAS domain-containing protein, partial [Enterobacter hormaechei]|uniref:PAS domain-containing protein n=2 Tax=Pseudomonadota TaxID=1224 RepID=UPI0013D6551A